MSGAKHKQKKLRMQAASRGILSIAELARLVPCSRTTIYESLERPARFPAAVRRINQILTGDHQ